MLDVCPALPAEMPCCDTSLVPPGHGPAAPGDLQWLLRAAPGHGPAPSGQPRGTPGPQQRSLSVPVHPEHRAAPPALLSLPR